MSNSKAERFQTIGTALAIIISLAAMFISLYEASIMKSQQASMVWPYLDMSQQYNSDGFAVEISNKGTGPAIITSVQVDYKGQPVESMDILMDSLNPNRTFGYDILRNSTIGNQVLMSGEKRIVFGLPYNEETRIVQSNLDKIRVRIGYKSVLDENWFFDSEDGSHPKEKFEATVEFKN
ncbi:hypothetical protein SAMN04490243_2868 [Robiginitalea myxolifaciens]|uniref:Uncharacterized protein n=1 Tax=Robiginitalea myxolifaciens TaxID=400055 RepID=A0A1I6HLE8_9FLAO|nr:hypothetical protein [Robiginitalea myxolifaciens]SFR55224.1 hypothetical protein SAMN04490243_2868 [Robiginitalea myxolifaciens]